MLTLDPIGSVIRRVIDKGNGVTCHSFTWGTADGTGNARWCGFDIRGEAFRIEYSNTDASAETYTVTLLSDTTADALNGLGATLAGATHTYKVISEITITSVLSRGLQLDGVYAFSVDCSNNTGVRNGVFDLYVRR